MDAAALRSLLARLSQARPGSGVLQLPPGLSPQEALRAIQAALDVLGGIPPSPRSAPAAGGGRTRLHIDGAARGNPGPAGVGVVVVAPDGQVLERLHRSIGEATNNVAEYRALLLGLDRARALGCTDLEVYSDSELLVRQLQGRYQVKHPVLRTLYAAARERIAGLRQFDIRHVPREANAEADALANRGIDEAARPRRRGRGPAPGDGGET